MFTWRQCVWCDHALLSCWEMNVCVVVFTNQMDHTTLSLLLHAWNHPPLPVFISLFLLLSVLSLFYQISLSVFIKGVWNTFVSSFSFYLALTTSHFSFVFSYTLWPVLLSVFTLHAFFFHFLLVSLTVKEILEWWINKYYSPC